MKILIQLIMSLFFFKVIVKAQSNSIQHLAFEGAGIRGIAYCGAIQAMEEKNILKDVNKVAGTSAGAITALCVSLGYSSTEIAAILRETNFKSFNDGRFLFAGGINRLNKYFGWYRGKRILQWLEKMIEAKTGNAGISFAELNQQGFKDLYITATCLNKQQLVVLSRLNYPNMKVKDAVRISLSIPLYFEAVFIDANGMAIHHPKNTAGLDIMIDGGFTGNFPLRIFDSVYVEAGTQQHLPNRHSVGFRIDSDEQIASDKDGKGITKYEINNFRSYVGGFYNIIIENLNRQTLTPDDWSRTVSISDGKIGPRIRKMSKEEVNQLIENGYKATQLYLNKLKE